MSNVNRSAHEDPHPCTVTLTADEVCHIRGALAAEMKHTSKIIGEHLKDHAGGNGVALSDARNWIESLASQAALLEKIDPPGWREPFGRKEQAA